MLVLSTKLTRGLVRAQFGSFAGNLEGLCISRDKVPGLPLWALSSSTSVGSQVTAVVQVCLLLPGMRPLVGVAWGEAWPGELVPFRPLCSTLKKLLELGLQQ